MNNCNCPTCGFPRGSCSCGYKWPANPDDKNNAAVLGYNPCTPPPPCPPMPSQMPPVPPRHCGTDPYAQMEELRRAVNGSIAAVNQLLDKSCGTLKAIESRAVNIGAYYSPKSVNTRESYSAEDGSKYWLTRVRHKDTAGRPINMELHFAYMDTGNNGVVEPIFEASYVEMADKMFTAMTDASWFGHVRQNGVPVPSNVDNDYYTMGFTRSGTLKWYQNSVAPSQLSRDQIVNSMGVFGITAIDGQWTDDSYRTHIPTQDEKVPRVLVGQNPESKETFILSTGTFEDTSGMLTKTATDLLTGYGCKTVIEVATGAKVAMLDKGAMLFAPTDNKVPECVAYWYISKKRHFTNDYQRELALLFQQWGAQQWQLSLLRDAVTNVEDDLADVVSRVDNLEDRVVLLETWQTEVNDKLDEIDGSIADINNQLAALDAKIEQEIQDRKDADEVLQGNIDAESEAREAADKVLQDNINAEEAARIAADEALQQQITDNLDILNQEIQDRITAVQELRAALDVEIQARIDGDTQLLALYEDLRAQLVQLQADLNVLANRVETNYNTLYELYSGLRDSYNQLSAWFADLQATLTAIDNVITGINSAINEIKQTLLTLEECCAEMQDWKLTVDADLEDIHDQLTALQSYFSIRGSVQNYSDLADITGQAANDGYIVIDDETREDQTSIYVWDGSEWVYAGRLGIDIANYYTKSEIDALLAGVETDLSNYYTKDEVDGLIEDIDVDLSLYALKLDINMNNAATSVASLQFSFSDVNLFSNLTCSLSFAGTYTRKNSGHLCWVCDSFTVNSGEAQTLVTNESEYVVKGGVEAEIVSTPGSNYRPNQGCGGSCVFYSPIIFSGRVTAYCMFTLTIKYDTAATNNFGVYLQSVVLQGNTIAGELAQNQSASFGSALPGTGIQISYMTPATQVS